MKPWMLDEEISIVEQLLEDDMVVFEWGRGGSTVTWAPLVKKWYTVENDKEWYDKVKNNSPENVVIFFCDNEEYYKKPLEIDEHIDFYIIDGRYRFKCRDVAYELLEVGDKIIVHDSIRYEPDERLEYKDLHPGLEKGNHKGLRLYKKVESK